MKFKALKKIWSSEDGATAIEYGLIAALVAVAVIGSVGAVGSALNDNYFEEVKDSMNDVNTSTSTSTGG